MRNSGKLRVFIIDDEQSITVTLATILRMNGYETFSYTDPRYALFSLNVYRPHVVLTDVDMPLLSGYDLARQVRRRLPGCEVILFTGNTEAKAEPGYRMLFKPLRPQDIMAELDRVPSRAA